MSSAVPTTSYDRMLLECVAMEAAAMAIESVTNDLRKSFGQVAGEAIAKVETEAKAGRLGLLRRSWSIGREL